MGNNVSKDDKDVLRFFAEKGEWESFDNFLDNIVPNMIQAETSRRKYPSAGVVTCLGIGAITGVLLFFASIWVLLAVAPICIIMGVAALTGRS